MRGLGEKEKKKEKRGNVDEWEGEGKICGW